MSFPVKPNNDPQILTLDHPRTGQEITLRLADWEKIPGKDKVNGLDNTRLFATRSPDFAAKVQPMHNIGGLVSYPRGG